MLSYFYALSMFIYRWRSNFVEKVGWKESDKDAIACFLTCVLYYMEGWIWAKYRENSFDN